MNSVLSTLDDLVDITKQLAPRLFGAYSFSRTDLQVRSAVPTLDLLSYNVNFALAGPAASHVTDAIIVADADVVMLQETSPFWEPRLRALGYAHAHFLHAMASEQPAGGACVLSRFPLSRCRALTHHQEVPGSVFPALAFVVETPHHGKLRMCTVHLRPPVEMSGGAGLSTARTTGSVREAEAHALLGACVEGLDVVAGDFNEQDGGHALAVLHRAGLSDALAEHVPPSRETHRWWLPVLGLGHALLRKRLDHVTYSPRRLECVGCGVVTGYEEGASDHQPVLARFALASAAES